MLTCVNCGPPGVARMAPMKYGLSVLPSILPSAPLSILPSVLPSVFLSVRAILWNCIFRFFCCVPVQSPYLGKFLFLTYGTKCSQPIRLQDFLINHTFRRNQWYSTSFHSVFFPYLILIFRNCV